MTDLSIQHCPLCPRRFESKYGDDEGFRMQRMLLVRHMEQEHGYVLLPGWGWIKPKPAVKKK